MQAVFDDAQAAQCGVNGRTPAVAFVEGGETTSSLSDLNHNPLILLNLLF